MPNRPPSNMERLEQVIVQFLREVKDAPPVDDVDITVRAEQIAILERMAVSQAFLSAVLATVTMLLKRDDDLLLVFLQAVGFDAEDEGAHG